ncbi:MAG TPA: GAF domain-containing protein [Actinomycetes bacterium]
MSGQERAAPHENYQELYDLTPAAYLVTDPNGIILQANRRASRLLGSTGRFLGGRALSSFVAAEQRAAFRERLGQAEALEGAGPWLLRVGARGGEPVTVAVAVTAARDDSGRTVALRWLLAELPRGQERRGAADGADPERLASILEKVARAAVTLLRADHVSVIAENGDGQHRWMVAAGDAGEAFERLRRELAAGPCLEAMRLGRAVWTPDIVTDQRWPELIRAVATHQDLRGALAAPVLVDGRGAGACLALSAATRVWSDAELAATGAFAAVVAQALRAS